MTITETVWLREGPGENYLAIVTYNRDVIVTVLAKSQDGQWLFVSFPDGQQGWVSSTSIQSNVSDCDVPVATAGPTYTPLPTVGTRDPGDPCARAQRQHQRIIRAYDTSSGDPGYDRGADLNNDGKVNIVDIGIMVDNWPEGCPKP